MQQIIDFLATYHLAVMGGILLLLFMVPKKNSGGKFLRLLMILLAASILYEIIWQQPVSEIPRRIDRALNGPQPKQSINPHYYRIPEEEKKLLDKQ